MPPCTNLIFVKEFTISVIIMKTIWIIITSYVLLSIGDRHWPNEQKLKVLFFCENVLWHLEFIVMKNCWRQHVLYCHKLRQGGKCETCSILLYAFFWVIPQRLNFICRCLGTFYLFHLHRQAHALSPSHTFLWPPCGSLLSTACFYTLTHPYPVTLLPIGSGYFRAEPFPVYIPQHFSNLVILHTYPPMIMEQIECSEMSAHKIQTLGNYPEESIQHSEHNKSLKSRMQYLVIYK